MTDAAEARIKSAEAHREYSIGLNVDSDDIISF